MQPVMFDPEVRAGETTTVIQLRSRIGIDAEALRDLCQRHRIRELAVFGSVLRPDFDDASDIDVLVEFDPKASIGMLALGRLQRELSALVGRPVDLVPKSGLKPTIRQAVLAGAQTIYAT